MNTQARRHDLADVARGCDPGGMGLRPKMWVVIVVCAGRWGGGACADLEGSGGKGYMGGLNPNS